MVGDDITLKQVKHGFQPEKAAKRSRGFINWPVKAT